MAESISLEPRGDVVVMRMQHGKANPLDLEFCGTLVDTLNALAKQPVLAVVLTGTGTIFSAGVDLLRLQSEGPPYIERFVPMVSKLVRALFEFPRPMIAAINGHAVAGGCVMACTADHRIMAKGKGRIGVPELLVGVPFPTAALEMVRFVVPGARLQTIVYEGANHSPEDAQRLGLVDALEEPDALLDVAIAAAERMAALPPAAFALTKRQLRAPVIALIEAGRDRDVEVGRLWQHPDALARIRSHVERTFKPAV